MLQRHYILLKHLKMVLNSHFPNAILKEDDLNFRCNICHDSKKSKFKRRAHFKVHMDNLIFKCFNCNDGNDVLGERMSPLKWLKRYYPINYRQYIKETLRSNNEPVIKNILFDEKPKDVKKQNSKYFKNFIPILDKDDDIFKRAVSILEKRRISKNIWKDWFVCLDGRYRDRIIIPIYDKDENAVFWQGRTIIGKEPKYLNCLGDKNQAVFSQIEKIDKAKPVIVIEGYIDSLFIDNSISVLSTNWSLEIQKKLDKLDCYYLIDLDPTNETKQKCIRLLKEGKYMFNWKQYLKNNSIMMRDKWDVNELYIYQNREEKYTFDELSRWFTNKWFDKIWFI